MANISNFMVCNAALMTMKRMAYLDMRPDLTLAMRREGRDGNSAEEETKVNMKDCARAAERAIASCFRTGRIVAALRNGR